MALDRDLDLIRLVKTNKNLGTLARCTHITDLARFEHLGHAKDNVIDLDAIKDQGIVSIQAPEPAIAQQNGNK